MKLANGADAHDIETPEQIAEARRLLEAAGFAEPDGRVVVHTRSGGIGADWDLAEALAFYDTPGAVRAWRWSLVAHELGVLAQGRTVWFDVKAPAP